jgi:hypothetical protein
VVHRILNKNEYYIFIGLFFAGLLLSALHTVFSALTVGLLAVSAYIICNTLSKKVFGKELEIPSKTDFSQKLTWTDWLLYIPFTCLWLFPLFAIGEAADCIMDSEVWEHMYGFCQ